MTASDKQQEQQQQEQQRQLKIQQGIRQAEDALVQWIEDALDNTNYEKLKPGKNDQDKKLEESQFRNLVRVADTTESPEVIKNFLRYQVGRDEKWGRGKDSLAERIIQDISTREKGEKLRDLASTIAQNAAKGAGDPDAEDSSAEEIERYTRLVWIELIRRYLGYGARYLTYLNKGKTPS